MSARSILLLEDENNVGSTLTERLVHEGFHVQWARSCEEARLNVGSRSFDLALVDVGLPDGSGYEFAEKLRAECPSTAIVFLTALGNPEQRVKGLELGAEDYVVKPFHLKELLIRIRKVIERKDFSMQGAGSGSKPRQIGRAKVQFARFEAEVNGQKQALTHKECALLKLLVEHEGRVVSRDEILNTIWSEDEFPSSRTVDNFILKLRRLIEQDPESPVLIRSIRGVGYLYEEKT